MKVLVTGATGRFANLVVPALLERGVDVRAIIHDPDKAEVARRHGGIETVHADLADRESIDSALDGVDGAFLITPAFHPDATRMGVNFVWAAAEAGVDKLVYNGVYHPSLSLINHAGTQPVEEAIYRSDLDFTIFQPAMYLQGLADVYEQALHSGQVVMPWSKRSQLTYVDYRDVADAVAIAFTDDRLARGTFELAAGGMVDRVRIAEAMSKNAGTELLAVDPLPEGQTRGAPQELRAMFADYDRHGFHGGNSLALRTILGREPRSVTDYVEELALTGPQP